jgi:two-component system response regulator AtoC
MGSRIIVVDDDRDYLELTSIRLAEAGFEAVDAVDDPLQAAERFGAGSAYDLALIDIGMPEMDGQALLQVIKHRSPATECIMVTAVNDARTAVDCLRQGAYEYLVKPVSEDDLIFGVGRALERKRLLDIIHVERSPRPLPVSHPEAFRGIITRSIGFQRLLKEAELHAASDVPILVTGESGTGKELLARAIHLASPRSRRRFLPINMAALSGELFEAEFFGHTKGAFTGAERERDGHLKHCDGGTLFLDEIGNLPLSMQGKLLRMLQDGEFTPLGSSMSLKADVRFVAATNEDLDRLMESGRFRSDLFYRIRGSWLHLTPLRERPEDIPLLAEHFLREAGAAKAQLPLADDVVRALVSYDFPGNVRELRSVIRSALNLTQGKPISRESLPAALRRRRVKNLPERARPAAALTLVEVEKRHILDTYRRMGGNKMRTARVLGLGLNTLRRKLKGYGIDRPDKPSGTL